jgi:protein-tyrosine phosphatase
VIDLHSHLLPDIDDGSRSVEQSVETLARLARDGVTHVALTPHLRAGDIVRHGEDMIAQREETLAMLEPAAPNPPLLSLGFEIMLDQELPEAALGDRRYAIAGTRYYLVEFSTAVVGTAATRVLEQIVAAGAIPLVAHPERYRSCTTELLAAWREAGARMQVDATTLTRASERGWRARQILRAGLADILAADNHGDSRTLRTGVQYLAQAGVGDVARLLAVENPAAILKDREPEQVPPVALQEGLLSRLKRFVSGEL